ncbi:MAG: S53 family peptidase [Actinomycetota bacterium]|nr:S53 family peptidase [Actinomycetota bacterium]
MHRQRLRLAIFGASALALISLTAAPAGASPTKSAKPSVANVCGPAKAGFARCFSQILLNPSTWRGQHARKPGPPPGGGSTTPSGYSPADLQSAYNLASASSANGSGVTVAIVDAYSNPYLASNLATYRTYFGLPPCTTASGCLTIVNQAGGTKLPRGNSGWGTEEALDVEMVSAICPNCNVLVVEASSNSMSNLAAAAAYAGANAQVVSNSYGSSEFSAETSYDPSYSGKGVTFVASSGDNGYGVEYPAASPDVVAAGGTTLSGSSTSGWSQTAWSGAGSGCSAYEANPGWQPYTRTVCADMRQVADTSAVADPNTGVAMYDTYGQSGWMVVGGTSVASPIIASVFALANNDLGSKAAKQLYSATGGLTTVNSGANAKNCTTYLCNASDSFTGFITGGAGVYNGPTGVGTPNGIAAF